MGANRLNNVLDHYSGSTSLNFVCEYTTLSIDQVNFITCQLTALLLSLLLRSSVRNPQTRLWYTLISGVSMCLFCFGVQTFHVLASGGLSYILMRSGGGGVAGGRIVPWLVLTTSMLYLSFLHLKRQFYDHSQYALDITGPLMVLTQKVTSLAFSLRDQAGGNDEGGKTELQRRLAVGHLPPPLTYASYLFQFQSMLAGPLVFYRDYIDFIQEERSPNPARPVFYKLGLSIIVALLFIRFGPQFNFQYVRDDHFLTRTTFIYKLYYITLATTLERCKYYHAWILADAVCNASGLGYNHLNNSWDLVSNVDAIEFESGLNLKESLDKWNIGTMRWLRHVVYERAPSSYRTMLVYILSAFWHGFYPGYYITFVSGALFTVAGRVLRRHIRPLFLNSLHPVYNLVTWLCTRLLVAYVTFPFVVQDFWASVAIFRGLYFFMHVGALLSILLAPYLRAGSNFAPSTSHSPTPPPPATSTAVGGSVEKTAAAQFESLVRRERSSSSRNGSGTNIIGGEKVKTG